jgi:AAHS family 4-hydroxybenzoate transporter-like MFS transporter
MRNHEQRHAGVAEPGMPGRGIPAWTLAIWFLVVLLDGLDTTSIAFVAPVLGREWALPGAAFTPAFIATSLGAVIGYVACGPLVQRFGRRSTGLASVALFGAGSLLTALAGDIVSLSLLRLVSAIGLGGALPIAIASAAGVVPPARRATAAVLAGTGFAAGSVVGGVAGGPLMTSLGWPSVFILGGVLPLALLPAVASALRSQPVKEQRTDANPIAALLRDGFGIRTGLLWLFAFLVFLVSYALGFWIPTLLTEGGFTPDRAPLGAAALGMGGLVGSVAIMSTVGRLGVERVLVLGSLLAIACIATLSQAAISPGLSLPLIAGAGAGLIGGSIGQSALAVLLYPPELRAAGIGCAAAAGRVGSIVGPGVGGAMLSLGWPAHAIVLTAVVPIAAAILALGAMSLAGRGSAVVALRAGTES